MMDSNLILMLQKGDDNVYSEYLQEASRNKIQKFSISVSYSVCRELMGDIKSKHINRPRFLTL